MVAMRAIARAVPKIAPKIANAAARSGSTLARQVPKSMGATLNRARFAQRFSSISSMRTMQSRLAVAGSMVAAWCALHYFVGTKHEYVYEHRFITKADPEDMAEFYGAEDFMEIFGVLPFVAKCFLRTTEFDEDGVAHAYGLPGQLEIELQFDQDEKDTNGDGEPDTTVGFNKNMKWNDVEPFSGATMWGMDHDFGFRQLEDGQYEVYHTGKSYYGPYPLYLVWKLHSWYVARATEAYLSNPLFSDEDGFEEREHLRNRLVVDVGVNLIDSTWSTLFM